MLQKKIYFFNFNKEHKIINQLKKTFNVIINNKKKFIFNVVTLLFVNFKIFFIAFFIVLWFSAEICLLMILICNSNIILRIIFVDNLLYCCKINMWLVNKHHLIYTSSQMRNFNPFLQIDIQQEVGEGVKIADIRILTFIVP